MSTYPGALDNFDEDHSDEPDRLVGPDADDLAAGVNAVQATLGVNPQGESATVVARLDALDAAKQDASSAATDVELAAEVAAREAADAALEASLEVAINLKQDAATAATDVELAAAVATIDAALALKQDSSTAATDAELSAHINDTTAAHAASAVAFTPAGEITADNVQDAVEEAAALAGGGGPPTGAAGGVLSGTYPDPGFAVDMATQAELDTEAATRAADDVALSIDIATEATTRSNADALLAPKANPALTGTPTAPTAAQGTNTTQIATTAYVQTEAGLLLPKSLLDAKGDLIVASGADTPARLAAGTDGHVLTLDSTEAVGMKWAEAAGGGGGGDPDLTVETLGADVGPITSQTTLQNITGLTLPISASATEMWIVEYYLIVLSANATMDIKIGFTGPAGATAKWGTPAGINTLFGWGSDSTGSTPAPLVALSATLTFGSKGTIPAGSFGLHIRAVVFGGGTAGNVQIQYAQNTSDAGNLTIERGSTMQARKVAA